MRKCCKIILEMIAIDLLLSLAYIFESILIMLYKSTSTFLIVETLRITHNETFREREKSSTIFKFLIVNTGMMT